MFKIVTTRLATRTLAAAGLAAVLMLPNVDAQAAQGRHAAAAAGAVGGLALGAALGAASQANSASTRGGMVYEEPGPAYVEEDCTIVRHRVWVEGYGWQMRRERVCE